MKDLEFESRALQAAFDEYRLSIEEIEGRIRRLESEIHEQAEQSVHAPVIKALQTFRGIKETAAMTMVAEVGKFSRFKKASQVMGYSGTVPSEYSSVYCRLKRDKSENEKSPVMQLSNPRKCKRPLQA